MDSLEQALRDVPGVQTTTSISTLTRRNTAVGYEGDQRWMIISRDPAVSTDAVNNTYVSNPEFVDGTHAVVPVVAFLPDHKAATLERVVQTVEEFAARNDAPQRQFLLAAGSAGIEAATNIAVEKANRMMLALVYVAVVVLCFITFRNWRTALGVGISVDYALYLVSVQIALQRQGVPLADAYRQALGFTGKVIALIGVTLAVAVVTWVYSPIKFQAVIWNMVGALVLIPALSHFFLRVAPDGKTRHVYSF